MFAEGLDYLPVSALAEIEYCPRNFYYRIVERIDDYNLHVLKGKIQEDKRERRKKVTLPDTIHYRSEMISSDTLGLIAVIDALEDNGEIIPIEYKSGELKESLHDDLQLCAEAMILEEATDQELHHGYVYYTASRRRREVVFTDRLRQQVREYMQKAWEILHSGRVPDPVADERCEGCSLRPNCLPWETLALEDRAKSPEKPGLPRMLGRTLVIDEQGAYLRKDHGQLLICKGGEELSSVPALEVDQLVLVGHIQASTQLLTFLLDCNVEVHYVSYYGRYQGHFVPEYHKNVKLRLSQTQTHFDTNRRLEITREFVRGKLHNMRTIIRRASYSEDNETFDTAVHRLSRALRHIKTAESVDTLRGMEGSATREYFAAYSHLISDPAFNFEGRNRRPPKDPVNALLSFAYTMMTADAITALSVAGLDPYIGFYHSTKYGRPALALDLLEEFRPMVADTVVRRLINTNMVSEDNFTRRVGGCFLDEAGREAFFKAYDRRKREEATHPEFEYTLPYGRMFELQARILSKVITGDLENYTPFTIR